MTPELRQALASIAASPVLLVACDYDGTLAPIVDDPEKAVPLRESIVALRGLSAMADTHVAVISGRSLRDLAMLSRLPDEVHLVGSHGSEFDAGFAHGLDQRARSLRDTVQRDLHALAVQTPGAFVEEKPTGAAFHYRLVEHRLAMTVVDKILAGPAALAGVRVRHGKMVIELSVVDTDKGTALDQIRRQVHADAVLFVGDDITDEDGFGVLLGPDVGVKVGVGDTLAAHVVNGPTDVARMLAELSERRRSWLEGDGTPEIERHSLLSDQRTVALVTPDARITWLCHPRPDSPAVFAELLGGASAGSFTVAPVPYRAPLDQRYVGQSMVLETRWADLRVTDYMDASFGRPFEPVGRTNIIRVLEGDCRVCVEFAPRLDFGRAPAHLVATEFGIDVIGASEMIRLHTPDLDWEIVNDGLHDRARAVFEVRAGEPIVLEMALGLERADALAGPERERRQGTSEHWTRWASGLDTTDPLVRRSALILKALCHQPTGAVLAAATTSLPEVLGGVRNWDYRFCWPRDSAVVTGSLVELGSSAEALAYLEWLGDRVATLPSADRLRPLYPLSGDEFLPEAVIPTLNGYRGSRPVRIGNQAEHQLQLDMFGPIVDLIDRLRLHGVVITTKLWDLTVALVNGVGNRWREPDHGIWEERRSPRHHVHSKVMCWMAFDRGVAIAKATARPVPEGWEATRDAIHGDVVSNGWHEGVQAFTAVYGDPEMDASILQIVLAGFLPPDDPRIISTVARVERELRDGAVVYRYKHDDGLPGREGGFLICTTWLIEALVLVGRIDDARVLYDRYCEFAGPTGMFAEQYDPEREVALGNVPQGYSHAGLIFSSLALRAVADVPSMTPASRGSAPSPTSSTSIDGVQQRPGMLERLAKVRQTFQRRRS
ncbi:MAG: trehalose-phosphatase [Acidimicrobiia bacterium]